jgi:hypothetical protein
VPSLCRTPSAYARSWGQLPGVRRDRRTPGFGIEPRCGTCRANPVRVGFVEASKRAATSRDVRHAHALVPRFGRATQPGPRPSPVTGGCAFARRGPAAHAAPDGAFMSYCETNRRRNRAGTPGRGASLFFCGLPAMSPLPRLNRRRMAATPAGVVFGPRGTCEPTPGLHGRGGRPGDNNKDTRPRLYTHRPILVLETLHLIPRRCGSTSRALVRRGF